MSAPKFTPGEWRVGVNGHDADMLEDSGEWAPVIEGTEEDGGVIAWVHPAHAAKVAAVPELYEVARDLLALHERGWIYPDEPSNPLLVKARAALGKAVPHA